MHQAHSLCYCLVIKYIQTMLLLLMNSGTHNVIRQCDPREVLDVHVVCVDDL